MEYLYYFLFVVVFALLYWYFIIKNKASCVTMNESDEYVFYKKT